MMYALMRENRAEEVRPAIQAALSSARAAVVEAVVDANEKPTKPDDLKAWRERPDCLRHAALELRNCESR
jgi:thiamine pyrophosphate-dependent acetolactate synthase large subunit-like protein